MPTPDHYKLLPAPEPEPEEKPGRALTFKQRRFVDGYVGECNGNGTEAARLAGYSGSDQTLGNIASELLDKAHVRREIQKFVSEHAMGRDEALEILAAHARGSYEDFIRIDADGNMETDRFGRPVLDLAKAKRRNKLRLIKKLKFDKEGGLELELYDAQAAVEKIAKHLGLFDDKVKLTVHIEQIVQQLPAGARERILELVRQKLPGAGLTLEGLPPGGPDAQG